MLSFADTLWRPGWIQDAAGVYFGGTDRTVEGVQLQLFLPWVVHHWDVRGQPLREWFLERRGALLSREDHAWLLAQRHAVITVWEVLRVEPGTGLAVRDLLGREERFVQEVLGSRQLVPRDAVLGRLVDHEGLAVFCGLYPAPLPPRSTEEIVRAARRVLRVPGERAVSQRKLALPDTALGLVQLWSDEVEFVEHLASLEEGAGWLMRTCGLEDDPRLGGEQEPLPTEVRAVLRELKALLGLAWLDMKLPLLEGRTPRQAVRTAVGRREVDLLLKEVEHREARLPGEERMDVVRIRRELGLSG